LPKAITFTDMEKDYLLTICDQAYENYGRREKLEKQPELKQVLRNAADKTRALREKITKEA